MLFSFEAQWARGPSNNDMPQGGIPGMGEVDQIPNHLPGLGGPVGSGPPPEPTIGFRGARGGEL